MSSFKARTFLDLKKAAKLLSLRRGILLILVVSASVLSGCWTKPMSLFSPSPKEVSEEKEDFFKKSRSSVQVKLPFRGRATIYLYAPDEKQGVVEWPYCGGGLGAKTYDGHYELILFSDSKVIDRLPLGELSFVEETPFDGKLRVENVKAEGGERKFITLFQYLSCNMNEALIFGFSDLEEKLLEVPFVRKGGDEVAVYIDPGKTGLLAESKDCFVTRYYDNSVGRFRVTEWVFNLTGERFEELSYREE